MTHRAASSVKVVRFPSERLASALPLPAADADKCTRGKLTVIGGSDAYPGSVCLASKAGLYGGAGYVACACSAAAVPILRAFAPSCVVRVWEGADATVLKLDAQDGRHPQACAMGCGMASDGGFQDALVAQMIDGCAAPLLLDGGALRTLAERGLSEPLQARGRAGRQTVLTPHGGEAAALARAVGIPVPGRHAPEQELAAFAAALAEAFAAHVLLKGPVSFIASPASAEVFLMDRGTPALAKAGTGDVLVGVVGALLAQGLHPATACVMGATVHAEAGRAAAEERGVISVTAEDVLEALPCAFQAL